MTPRLAATLLFLALCAACATPRVVRLDTGEGAPLEYRPRTFNASMGVDEKDFEAALTRLVLETPLTLLPSQQGRLVRASYPGNDADERSEHLLRKSFGGVCKAGQRREDCLSRLHDVKSLSQWDKLGVTLGLSLDPMRQSIARAVEDTLAPQLFYTVIATGLVTWVALAANPEPVFTKAAALVSAMMLVYLGVDAFLDVMKASRELKRATDRATTVEELEDASQHFGRAVGPRIARVLVLAVTVAVSHGMTGGAAWLASRLSMLPHFPEAAALGASQVGIWLARAGQVSGVAVVEGNLVITLASTAVAMMAGSDAPGDAVRTETASTPTNYRETFFTAHPGLRGKVLVHHSIEQQVLKKYPGLFTEAEIHSLKNLRGIPKSINPDLHLSKLRRAWNDFYRTHLHPTRQQVIDFAAQLDRQFGAFFDPPL
ncbi:MAG TPA: hypothetical protein VEU33_02280 [Archangium sp.]|nr:hypothetical protein [Archangium sp.]